MNRRDDRVAQNEIPRRHIRVISPFVYDRHNSNQRFMFRKEREEKDTFTAIVGRPLEVLFSMDAFEGPSCIGRLNLISRVTFNDPENIVTITAISFGTVPST